MKDIELILKQFRAKVVMTIEELTDLDMWSTITVRRRLKSWGAYTSYNHNGRYYVLPEIPRFDTHGLWIYNGIRFSKSGALTKTTIHLVHNSTSGMLTPELSGLLGCQMHSVLSRLTNRGAVQRKRNFGRNVYFSAYQKKFESQEKMRKSREPSRASCLSEKAAVILLLEKIKNPDATVQELVLHAGTLGVDINVDGVRDFFQRHDLPIKSINH